MVCVKFMYTCVRVFLYLQQLTDMNQEADPACALEHQCPDRPDGSVLRLLGEPGGNPGQSGQGEEGTDPGYPFRRVCASLFTTPPDCIPAKGQDPGRGDPKEYPGQCTQHPASVHAAARPIVQAQICYAGHDAPEPNGCRGTSSAA